MTEFKDPDQNITDFKFPQVTFLCIKHGWIEQFVIDSTGAWACPECFHVLTGAQCQHHATLNREKDVMTVGINIHAGLCRKCLTAVSKILEEKNPSSDL